MREKEGLDDLEQENDNLRAALEWFSRRDRAGLHAMAGALGWYWHLRSYFREGRARLNDALADCAGQDAVRARALSAAGELAAWACDIEPAQRSINEAVAIWKDLGQEQEAALALLDLGWGYFFCNDNELAKRCMESSLGLLEARGDSLLINRARTGLLQVLVGLGELDLVESMAPEVLRTARATNDLRSEHFAIHFLADCFLIRGNYAAAEAEYRRSLGLAVELGERSEVGFELQGVSMAAAGLSRPERALRLGGAVHALFADLGIDYTGIQFWHTLVARHMEMAREALGPAGEISWNEGLNVSLEDAIEEALGVEPSLRGLQASA